MLRRKLHSAGRKRQSVQFSRAPPPPYPPSFSPCSYIFTPPPLWQRWHLLASILLYGNVFPFSLSASWKCFLCSLSSFIRISFLSVCFCTHSSSNTTTSFSWLFPHFQSSLSWVLLCSSPLSTSISFVPPHATMYVHKLSLKRTHPCVCVVVCVYVTWDTKQQRTYSLP